MSSPAQPEYQQLQESSSATNDSARNVQILETLQPPPLPKKPPSGYYIFYRHYFEKNVNQFKQLKTFGQYSKVVASQWKTMTDEEKQPYMQQHQIELNNYQQQLNKYYQSPAYQQYQLAKQKAEQRLDSDENKAYLEKIAQTGSSLFCDNNFYMESSKDLLVDDNEMHSIRRLACINFTRNMTLMERLFDGVLLKELKPANNEGIPQNLDQSEAETFKKAIEELEMKYQKELENSEKTVEIVTESIRNIENDKKLVFIQKFN
ncbi:MAG: high mobility group [Paramarteilia canceri]